MFVIYTRKMYLIRIHDTNEIHIMDVFKMKYSSNLAKARANKRIYCLCVRRTLVSQIFTQIFAATANGGSCHNRVPESAV